MASGVKEMLSHAAERSKAIVGCFSIFKDMYSHSQTAANSVAGKKPKLSAEQGPDGRLSVLLAGTPGTYI